MPQLGSNSSSPSPDVWQTHSSSIDTKSNPINRQIHDNAGELLLRQKQQLCRQITRFGASSLAVVFLGLAPWSINPPEKSVPIIDQRGIVWHERYIVALVRGKNVNPLARRALEALDLPKIADRQAGQPEGMNRLKMHYAGVSGVRSVDVKALFGRGQDWSFQRQNDDFVTYHKPHGVARQPVDLIVTITPEQGTPTTVIIYGVVPE